MPQLEEGNLWIRAILPRTISREDAARMAPRLRQVIAGIWLLLRARKPGKVPGAAL